MKKYFIEYWFRAEYCLAAGDMEFYWNGEHPPTVDDVRGHLETPITGVILEVAIKNITEVSND